MGVGWGGRQQKHTVFAEPGAWVTQCQAHEVPEKPQTPRVMLFSDYFRWHHLTLYRRSDCNPGRVAWLVRAPSLYPKAHTRSSEWMPKQAEQQVHVSLTPSPLLSPSKVNQSINKILKEVTESFEFDANQSAGGNCISLWNVSTLRAGFGMYRM